MYVTAVEIMAALSQEEVVQHQSDGSVTYRFPLWEGDATWNPASRHNKIHGPARVTYTKYPDGGVTATVEEWAGGRQS